MPDLLLHKTVVTLSNAWRWLCWVVFNKNSRELIRILIPRLIWNVPVHIKLSWLVSAITYKRWNIFVRMLMSKSSSSSPFGWSQVIVPFCCKIRTRAAEHWGWDLTLVTPHTPTVGLNSAASSYNSSQHISCQSFTF